MGVNMEILSRCAPSRWGDFLSIPDDATPTRSGENVDLFVGINQRVTITLNNDSETRFRDVVVWGELILTSSDPQNTALKPQLVARDFFAPGLVKLNNINLKCRNFDIRGTREAFRSRLQDLFIQWIDFQRESTEEMGLISILF